MDGSVFSSAHGVVDSVIGRLTTLVVNEAQLLAGVHGDVEFISDEMGSMNGFVLHVSEAEYPDHQVRAWMKQVRDLAYSSEDCVDLYAQHLSAGPGSMGSGLWAYLRRLPWMLRTMPVRHQLATRIKELKVRAQEVGDRRHRYGVTVPPANAKQAPAPARPAGILDPRRGSAAAVDDAEDPDLWRKRLALVNEPPADAKEDVYQLVEWLREASGDDLVPRVIIVFGESGSGKTTLARNVRQHAYVKSCFHDVVLSKVVDDIIGKLFRLPSIMEDIYNKKRKFSDQRRSIYNNPGDIDDTLVSTYLKGKKYLIVFDDVQEVKECLDLMNKLRPLTSYSAGNAIILTTSNEEVVKSCNSFPHKLFALLKFRSHPHFYFERAAALVGGKSHLMHPVGAILQKCYPDEFTISMFLRLLYVNPDRTVKELKDISSKLEDQYTSKNTETMLLSCYTDLPRHCRNALLYLAIFPVGCSIRRTSFVRRWVFEGLITQADGFGQFDALNEAKRCFDELILRGFLSAVDTSVSGKVKSCKVNHLVHQFITGIARSVHFVDPGLPPELACHFSIRNRIGMEASRINLAKASVSSAMLPLLEFLQTSSQWQVLRVLDLEGCKGLSKRHLKNICKIVLLKYLSLRNTRNTDVTELPKEIQKLRCLETLDIRQTEIRAFASKHITLPMLKHLLAGHKESAAVTVRLPKGIRRMKNLEELCHVDASDNIDDVAGIDHLLQLRKLGVVLQGRKSSLTLLFQQIDKLCGCLCSLSIRVNTPSDITPKTEAVPALSSPPQLLESLNISGVIGRLPNWIEKLNKLGKITLSNTQLGQEDMLIIENLEVLQFLRLRNKSYTESKLTFRKDKFQSLKALDVHSDDITDISFDNGAAPKLERVVWSFTRMQSLSGIEHLFKLKEIQVNGECIPDPVKSAIEKHPNVLKHNLPDKTATANP